MKVVARRLSSLPDYSYHPITRSRHPESLPAASWYQLEEIIRGKNTTATLADVEDIQKTLDAYKLTGQDYLYEYIELIKGMKMGNTDKVLEMCKRVFPKMADEKIAYLYFMPILSLKGKWNDKQKEELDTLTEQLAEQVEMSTLKASLRNFKTAIARL